VHWPDFNKEEFVRSLHEYMRRQRRFGLVTDEANVRLAAADGACVASERHD